MQFKNSVGGFTLPSPVQATQMRAVRNEEDQADFFVEVNGEQMVNARSLHTFLENGKHFTAWFRHRQERYKLEEGEDFIPLPSANDKGRPSFEYALTLSTAKELSMVEASDKGKQARQYFIQKEQLAKVLEEGVMSMMAQMQRRIEDLEKSNKQLTLPASKNYTIMGYARITGVHVSYDQAKKIGKRAVQLCQIQGFKIKTVPDARWGTVNSYPAEILEAIFREQFPIM